MLSIKVEKFYFRPFPVIPNRFSSGYPSGIKGRKRQKTPDILENETAQSPKVRGHYQNEGLLQLAESGPTFCKCAAPLGLTHHKDMWCASLRV
jgi:hypothetical protein